MKLHEIDWQDFFRRLAVWEQLSLESRREFAKMQPSQPQSVAKFSQDIAILAEAGFVALNSGGRKFHLTKDCAPFASTIRLMVNNDFLGDPNEEMLHKYVTYQLDVTDREALCDSMGLSYWQSRELDQAATSVRWLERFLAAGEEDLKPRARRDSAWNYRSTWRTSQQEPRAERPAVPLETMKAVVRRFMATPEPVPIKLLPAFLPEVPVETLLAAVAKGVDRLLLFMGVRQRDMSPLLGLWPAISRRLHRPRLAAPAAVQPRATYDGAFLMEDMTTLLVAASAQPIRLRRDDLVIFAKIEQEITANLMSLPEWFAQVLQVMPPYRIASASLWLRGLKLLRRRSGGDYPRLAPTRRSPDWLAQSGKDRLKAILDHLRPKTSAAQAESSTIEDDDIFDDGEVDYGDYSYGYAPRTDFLPFSVEGGQPKAIQEMVAAVVSAFAAVPEGQFWPLDAFLAWRSQEHHPAPKSPSGDGAMRRFSAQDLTVEQVEARWNRNLYDFLCQRLVPLGGARLGKDGKEGVCFTLTPAGRYLLGLAEDFHYGPEHDPQGQMIVQPNFDVVFLAPSPAAEAALARIAERQGRGTGALFKITKKSILAAAGGGMTAAQTLEMLERTSSKPLPANVSREIQGWFDQCRRITIKSTVLIRCPDAATAARVVAASAKKASLLTDTLVELDDGAAKPDLVRKLHGQGIFVDKRQTRRNVE